MKIIAASNYDLDLFKEIVVAENVSEQFGKEMVKAWIKVHAHDHNPYFLRLVDDDYELYDGYAELL